MGLTYKNKNNYELNDELSSYFNLKVDENPEDDYELLKTNIYALDIDNEEKASILSIISELKTTTSPKKKKELEKELNNFKILYDL